MSATPGTSKQAVSGMMWMSSGAGLRAALHLLVMAVLARLLSPHEFGVVGAAMVVIQFSQILADLGVGAALVQRGELRADHIRTASTVSILMGVGLSTITWLTASHAAAFFEMPELQSVLRALTLIFLFTSISIVSHSLLSRDLQFARLAIIELLAVAVGYGGCGIILAVMDYGVYAIVGGHLAKSILRSIMLLVSKPHSVLPQFSPRACRELLYFGSGLTAGQLSDFVASEGDKLVVARFLGAAPLGIYGRAWQLTHGSAHLLSAPIRRVLFPLLSTLQNDVAKLQQGYRRGVSLLSLTLLPVTAVAVVIAPEIVGAMLGPQWGGVVLPFRILVAGIYLQVNDRLCEALLTATDNVYRVAWRRFLYAVLVVAGAWFGQSHGITGVATAMLAAMLVHFVLMSHLALDVVGMTWRNYMMAHVRGIACAVTLAVLAWLIAESLRDRQFMAISLVACTMSALLMITVCLQKVFLGPDAQWLIRNMFRVATPRVARPSVKV